MDLISEHNQRFQFFADITGEAMRVHRKFKPGLMESAYEAALKYLLELKREGLSFLFITHDLILAAVICDRILVMEDGRIRDTVNPDRMH
jgi:ABC-type uncharacterized transport system ATPase subunit